MKIKINPDDAKNESRLAQKVIMDESFYYK